MSAKNLATEGVDFTVKLNVESGTLKPEVQAADSRKERCDSVPGGRPGTGLEAGHGTPFASGRGFKGARVIPLAEHK